jgi:hypothetical protein
MAEHQEDRDSSKPKGKPIPYTTLSISHPLSLIAVFQTLPGTEIDARISNNPSL